MRRTSFIVPAVVSALIATNATWPGAAWAGDPTEPSATGAAAKKPRKQPKAPKKKVVAPAEEAPGPTLPTIQTVIEQELAQFLVGQDPLRTEWLVHRMEEFSRNWSAIAAYAIGATGGETAALTLQAAVADSDRHVRQAAIEALAYADAAASTRVLAIALHDPEPALRAQAVQVLGDLGRIERAGASLDATKKR